MPRLDLPDRRHADRCKVHIGGVSFFVEVGLKADGSPGEVFLILSRVGSDQRGWVDNLARSVSFLLQYGVPLNEVIDIYLGTKFKPHGIVVGDDRIKLASSPLDYMARFLGVYYGGREDLAHVPARGTS